jgi:hypothetical protein
MTPLHGLQTAVASPEKRESAWEPGDQARTADLYAAWKAIFQAAHSSAAGAAHSAANQQPGESDNREAPVRSVSVADSGAATASLQTPIHLRRVVGRPEIADAAADSRTETFARQNVIAEVVPLARSAASAASREVASVGVRIHYLGMDVAQSIGRPQPEIVSITLEGAEVSIVVRDGGLSETDALRTAFETARELTGRSSSLRQLTLNGRVLYEQAIRAALAPGVLFA